MLKVGNFRVHSGELFWAPTVDGVELLEHPWSLVGAGAVPPGVALLHGTNRDEGAPFVDVARNVSRAAIEGYLAEAYGPNALPTLQRLYMPPSNLPLRRVAASCGDGYMWQLSLQVPRRRRGDAAVPQQQRLLAGFLRGAPRDANLLLASPPPARPLCSARQSSQAERTWGDHWFACPARYATRSLGAAGVRTWVYHWAPATDTESAGFPGCNPHGQEVNFLWGPQPDDASAEDRALAATIRAYWTNFAKARRA